MGVPPGVKHFWVIAVVTLLLCALGCQNHKLDPEDSASRCSREMCVSMSHLLEEQTIRLRNVEEKLARTLAILTSNGQDFAATIAALKSDLQVHSLKSSKRGDSIASSRLRPPISAGWFDSPDRKKRQTEEQVIAPNEELAKESLAYVKKMEEETQYTTAKYDSLSESRVENSLPDKGLVHTQTAAQPTDEISFLSTSTMNSDVLTNTNNADTGSNTTATKKFVSDSIDDLQSAVKCAMAQLDRSEDGNLTDKLGILLEPKVMIHSNKNLTLQFEMRNCQNFWTAVWILIKRKPMYLVNSETVSIDSRSLLVVPKACLKKTGNVFLLSLPLHSEPPCSFAMPKVMECEVYNIDIIPIYYTLQGQSSNLEFTVPPEIGSNSTDLTSLAHWYPQNSTHSLGLKWLSNSRVCAQLLTSVNLRIYEDASDTVLRSYLIPAKCVTFDDKEGGQNFYSTVVSSSDSSCSSVLWKPLDLCRSYKLEIEPNYFSALSGKSSSLEMYTSGSALTNCCYVLTTPTGTFSHFVEHNTNIVECTWLISVAKNSTIWLTFSEFYGNSGYRVKVYDGPYNTSDLLVDHYEKKPDSVRSRSNKLFVHLIPQFNHELPQYHQGYGQYYNGYRRHYQYQNENSLTAHYIAVNDTGTPFIAGCGGYIKNRGQIVKTPNPLSENSSSVCKWYLETKSDSTLLITSTDGTISFPMIVYDDWSTDGKMIYNQTNSLSKASVTSFGSKMLVLFPAWNTFEREEQYTWQILTLTRCSYDFTSPSDTFSSHESNRRYETLQDCRWAINVETASKIQLTFVYFATEKHHDFVTIYDGPNLFSPVLLELSGVLIKPVTLTSTTNQLLVRFTTDWDDVGHYKGFLAVYSTVEKLIFEQERK